MASASCFPTPTAELRLGREDDTLRVVLAGAWTMAMIVPPLEGFRAALAASPPPRRLVFESSGVVEWDTRLPLACRAMLEQARAAGVEVDAAGLPPGVTRLLALAAKVPEREGVARAAAMEPLLDRVGGGTLYVWGGAQEAVAFLGEATLAVVNLFRGRAVFQPRDIWLLMRRCGIEALPIVSLISALVGLIFAYVGAVQLKMFGAEIYVSSLVGIAMTRVMGAIMTGIVMAGRTGAAFAAEIGTMQVNEEIDALRTLGISPMEFLVLPRLVAMTAMMPLLCIYSDFMGMLGGFLVGIFTFNLVPMEYLNYTWKTVALGHIWVGLFHSAVFGVLVALCGCLQGIRCGRDASAVGRAATSAVVTGIVSIVVATAIITICCDILKF